MYTLYSRRERESHSPPPPLLLCCRLHGRHDTDSVSLSLCVCVCVCRSETHRCVCVCVCGRSRCVPVCVCLKDCGRTVLSCNAVTNLPIQDYCNRVCQSSLLYIYLNTYLSRHFHYRQMFQAQWHKIVDIQVPWSTKCYECPSINGTRVVRFPSPSGLRAKTQAVGLNTEWEFVQHMQGLLQLNTVSC